MSYEAHRTENTRTRHVSHSEYLGLNGMKEMASKDTTKGSIDFQILRKNGIKKMKFDQN